MNYFTDRSKAVLLLLFMFTCAFIILSCLFHVITCCERTDLLTLLCVMFACVFANLPYGVSGQVWYLIDSISDLCLRLYIQ